MSPPLPAPRSRGTTARALAVNAATKPVNVAVPAGVAVAGLVIGAAWLVVVAVLVYVVLSVLTFFDAGEAEQVGARLRGGAPAADRPGRAPVQLRGAVLQRLEAARREEAAIRTAIAESDLSLHDLTGEVDGLMRGLETIATRAQRLLDYMATQDRRAITERLADARRAGDPSHAALADALAQQLETLERMDVQLSRFDAEIEHAATTLSLMRGQLVQLSIDSDAIGEEKLAEQARTLRERVGATAAAMAELSAEV